MSAMFFEVCSVMNTLTCKYTYTKPSKIDENGDEGQLRGNVKKIITSTLNNDKKFDMNDKNDDSIQDLLLDLSFGDKGMHIGCTNKRVIIEHDIYELNPNEVEHKMTQALFNIWGHLIMTDVLSFRKTMEAVQVSKI
jgi:hypothetical protein